MAYFFFVNSISQPPPPFPSHGAGRFRWIPGSCCACSSKMFLCGVQPREWSIRFSGLTAVPEGIGGPGYSVGSCQQWVLDQLAGPVILGLAGVPRVCAWSKLEELLPDPGEIYPDCPAGVEVSENCEADSVCVIRYLALTLFAADTFAEIDTWQHGPPGYVYPLPAGEFGVLSLNVKIYSHCIVTGFGGISETACIGTREGNWVAAVNDLIDIANPVEIELVNACRYLSETGCPAHDYDGGTSLYLEDCSCDWPHASIHVQPVSLP